ncbi:unnamed protein product [Medioppia subpectinata]|uniref:Uncharacterized protein n=1 Tax=Medioppia subpectinata TaxID=1979941 RepID=A0A7R9KSJ5_9ACAR|nr:unnamed protein product [Medioppia subpectinata]CAG2109072.1 unnamed protein product [Medioppia subpectinata]
MSTNLILIVLMVAFMACVSGNNKVSEGDKEAAEGMSVLYCDKCHDSDTEKLISAYKTCTAKSNCKDETVSGDIMKFGQCVQALYPKEFAKILSIREAQMSNPEECVNQMKTELQGYARADPSGVVKVMDCFRANVVPDHLAKCH